MIDIILSGAISPDKAWTIGVNTHYFTAAADYLDKQGSLSKDIGVEMDFYAKTTAVAGVQLVSGLSLFLPSEAYAGTDADPGLWGYFMITTNFSTEEK